MAGILNAIDVSARGLSAQRAKMNAIAQNMANAETVETAEGGPYRRKRVLLSENKKSTSFNTFLSQADTKLARTHSAHRTGATRLEGDRAKVSNVDYREEIDPESSFKLVYDPTHPKADEEGYVKMPDVEVINEMVDMMTASRAYEANTAVISAAKNMVKDALEI
ncbi:MAG: flagellar basal body rod protein FlgC [Candidatus Zixiibacteriota bacterium]|nr:MAG: flagellar basal body rod protein FlgC [candidate division Zixibacteria bacterium]